MAKKQNYNNNIEKKFKELDKILQELNKNLQKTYKEVNYYKKSKNYTKDVNSLLLNLAYYFFLPTLILALTFAFIVNIPFYINNSISTEPMDILVTREKVSPPINTYSDLNFRLHKVQKGESVYGIAQKYKLKMDTLLSINNVKSAIDIKPGDLLLIPSMSGIIRRITSFEDIKRLSEKYNVSVDDIMRINGIDTNALGGIDMSKNIVMNIFIPNATLSWEELSKIIGNYFIKPVRGYITSFYGWRVSPFGGGKEFHSGIDIAASMDTPVKASQYGVVIYAGWWGGYGNCVIIKHQNGYKTLYGHLRRIYVKRGQYVRQGQIIGTVGSTGRSLGPHLHFEVLKANRRLNPLSIPSFSRSGRWF